MTGPGPGGRPEPAPPGAALPAPAGESEPAAAAEHTPVAGTRLDAAVTGPAGSAPRDRAAEEDISAAIGRSGTAAGAAPAAAAPDTAGTVYDGRPPGGPEGGGGQPAGDGRMTPLHLGSHVVSRGTLNRLGVASSAAGLLLGAELMAGTGQQRLPATIRLFRPEPTRLAVMGAVRIGKLIAFRALAFGARVAVVTTEPQAWQGITSEAVGRRGRFAVLPAERPISAPATADRPILLVYDLGAGGPTTYPPELGPWQAQLTILRRFDRSALPVVQESRTLLLQRLDPPEAALLGSTMQLPAESVRFLEYMDEDMVMLLEGRDERRFWLVETETERAYCAGGTHGV